MHPWLHHYLASCYKPALPRDIKQSYLKTFCRCQAVLSPVLMRIWSSTVDITYRGGGVESVNQPFLYWGWISGRITIGCLCTLIKKNNCTLGQSIKNWYLCNLIETSGHFTLAIDEKIKTIRSASWTNLRPNISTVQQFPYQRIIWLIANLNIC